MRGRESLLSAPTRVTDLIRAIDQPFDAHDPDHLEACRRLWQAAWPEVAFEGLVHGGWTRLGFSSGDLVKELGHGGITLVYHLLNLAKYAPALFASALEADVPLSAACTSVCLLLRGFLRLYTPGTVPQPIGGCGRVASDETRRRFLSWDETRSDAFDALNLEFVVYLLSQWQKKGPLQRQELTTLMDFPKALTQTRERIEYMLPRIEAGTIYQIRAVATS